MKVVRTLAIVLGFLFAHAAAHAQTNNATADGDPIVNYYTSGDAPSLVPQQGKNYYLTWGGGYTLAPGYTVWNFDVYAYNVNNPKVHYGFATSWLGGKWSGMTGTLPGGATYRSVMRFYVKNAVGQIVFVNQITSNPVTVP